MMFKGTKVCKFNSSLGKATIDAEKGWWTDIRGYRYRTDDDMSTADFLKAKHAYSSVNLLQSPAPAPAVAVQEGAPDWVNNSPDTRKAWKNDYAWRCNAAGATSQDYIQFLAENAPFYL